jgi:hypothetical protein
MKLLLCDFCHHLLIFQTESRHHFLGLVHVLRHFVRLWKYIADQFHEIVLAIIGEEIHGLNGHQLGNEGKEGHSCVLMKQLFQSFMHLIHPISIPHVTIMFIFCYDSCT